MELSESQKPPSTSPAGVAFTLAGGLGKLLFLSLFLVLFFAVCFSSADESKIHKPFLALFDPQSVEDLSSVLDAAWKELDSQASVPNVAPSFFPPDMRTLSVKDRKAVFVKSILPHVLNVNIGISKDRKRIENALEKIDRGISLSVREVERLVLIAKNYRMKDSSGEISGPNPESVLEELLLRVDKIPVSLAVAQAAVESAWGTSRFLLEGNSLFGQWVFSSSKGMRPHLRPNGSDYSVARFSCLTKAVEAYMRNLNTLWAYEDLRIERAKMRRDGTKLDAMELAQGLLMYSERRESYVEDVRQVLRTNRLNRFDEAKLEVVEFARFLSGDGSAEDFLTAVQRLSAPLPDG